jgi:chemotaxis protein CheD
VSIFEPSTTSESPRVERVVAYLHAGQLLASEVPREISMVLGSCVSVCLHDPTRGVGGANHFLLPRRMGSTEAGARFGEVAVAELVERVLAFGARRSELVAKMFGGAELHAVARSGAESLGAKNVAIARDVLARERIPIVAQDVGGPSGRRLVFRTDDGSAWVRRLSG